MQLSVKPRQRCWTKIAQGGLTVRRQNCALAWWRQVAPALLLVFLTVLFLLINKQPLLAQPAAGADPTHPLFPTATWLALPDDVSHWYAFRDEGDDTPIVVRMTVIPEHRASFAVLTAAEVAQWGRGEAFTPVGAGSELKLFRNDLYWTGSFVQSGTYYVLVKSNGQGASNYQLTINGTGVSFPLHSFAQPDNTLAAPLDHYPTGNRVPAAPFTLTPAITDTTVLSQPENPLPPIGKLRTITDNETHWYAFRDEGDASTIQITAAATPDHCLTFAVWTPEQFRLWQQGEEVHPVGQGTANATLKADLYWTGSFVKSGIYYVVVSPNPALSGSCTYKLTVLGDDVSLVMPTAP